MRKFYFNELIPWSGSAEDVQQFFSVLRAYRDIKQSFNDVVDGIYTKESAEMTKFGNSYVKDVLFSIGRSAPHEKDLYKYALSIFTKHPIEGSFIENDQDLNLISNDFMINLGDQRYFAELIYLIGVKSGILFTIPTIPELKKNQIELSSASQGNYCVDNLFGSDENKHFISTKLEEYRFSIADKFEKLLLLADQPFFEQRFKDDFNALNPVIKDAIISHLKKAKDFNFTPDGDLIKIVNPSNSTLLLCELRIQAVVAYRLYFYRKNNKLYLASIKKKPGANQQTHDINQAAIIVERLLN